MSPESSGARGIAFPLRVASSLAVIAALSVLSAAAACGGGEARVERTAAARRDTALAAATADAATAGAAHAGFDERAWRPPAEAAIPNDSLGASIRRGLALVRHTTDSLSSYATGRLTCSNCHLDAGRNPTAAPLTGSHARFPKYMERTGAVIDLADRVNYCFTRSLAGNKLPKDSREMQDMLAYLAFLSKGVPVGTKIAGAEGLMALPTLDGDSARGAGVYRAKCQACHGPEGAGAGPVPALWGTGSYSIGASMARAERAASFIWHNMPLGQGRSLTPQDAFDVATFVNAHPRPDSPGKENDWPLGGAPKDVPYATRSGHVAFRPPRLLARPNALGAIVPRPPWRAR